MTWLQLADSTLCIYKSDKINRVQARTKSFGDRPYRPLPPVLAFFESYVYVRGIWMTESRNFRGRLAGGAIVSICTVAGAKDLRGESTCQACRLNWAQTARPS